MDSEQHERPAHGTGPGNMTTGHSTQKALNPSPDSTEPSGGRRGSKRLLNAALTSPDSGRSRAGVRVLRARGARAGCRKNNESKDGSCQQTPDTSKHRGRGRAAGSRHTPAVQPAALKNSTAKKASKLTVGLKLSKTRAGRGSRVTRASRYAAAACRPEAETDASSGEETGSGSDDSVADPDDEELICNPDTQTEKSRRRTTLKQMEVKKEESEKEAEEDIKQEESTELVVQSEDGAGLNAEPPRKRGRQQKDDQAPRLPKQRKKPPVQYVRCEIEGCGTVLAHPRYLQHHIKYQHLLKKKYVCDHPSCGRLFRLQKQLLRHAKHHTDQRDYICEFCARAFKSSHNLAVHRMIHTGEKPIQCEICGFTCRQKASLNWHMKKHDAEASYTFSCSICSKRFEKKDSVVAHKAKSHPEVLIAEALAANGGSVIISSPTPETPTPDSVPVLSPSPTPENPRPDSVPVLSPPSGVSGTLTPLQQVVLPLASHTIDLPQGPFLQLPTHHVVQVAHHQQPPTLLHLTSPAQFSSISHPQLIQLSTLPASTVASMSVAEPQSTLLTLSSVTSLASQQAVQWGREAREDAPLPGEGELWDRVVVGGDHQDVGDMMWEGNEEGRKEEEVWEREGGRQILLQCAEVHGV